MLTGLCFRSSAPRPARPGAVATRTGSHAAANDPRSAWNPGGSLARPRCPAGRAATEWTRWFEATEGQ